MTATNALEFIGKETVITVDRPLGSAHPKHGWEYPLNYGFVPGTISPDGEELDAYILFVTEALETFIGVCIGVIQRTNDADDKLIIVPKEYKDVSDDEILKVINFQEQYFESRLIRI